MCLPFFIFPHELSKTVATPWLYDKDDWLSLLLFLLLLLILLLLLLLLFIIIIITIKININIIGFSYLVKILIHLQC